MYDEAAAKAAYLEHLADAAATQDLDQDRRPETRNLSIIFTVLAALFVGLRLVARRRQAARIGVDDWLILAALLLLIGHMAMNLELIRQGLGLHSGALTLPELQQLNKTVMGAEILYVTGVSVYKISLLFLYFRVFPVRSIRLGGYLCGGLSIVWSLACIGAVGFQCTPLNRLWEPWLQGTCIDPFITLICVSIPNILCDIVILCLPMPHVWRVHMSRTQRILVAIVFLLGSYVVFTSAYRFGVFLMYRPEDVSWTLAPGCAWNIIEISSGIVSACLPTLGPLFGSIVSKEPGQIHGSSKPSSWRPGGSLIEILGGRSARKRSPARGDQHVELPKLDSSGGSSGGSPKDGQGSDGDKKYSIDYHDPVLVPYRGDVTLTISHVRNSRDDSDDEIPLTAIRKHQHVEWTEERNVSGGTARCVSATKPHVQDV